MITSRDVPRLNDQAHAKSISAGCEDMSIPEFWAWAETLPEDEAVAMLVTMIEMQRET